MKRQMAIALLVAGTALPVCAQRGGGSRGGFSGYSAPAFHGSFAPTTHFSYASRPVYSGSRFAAAAPAYHGGNAAGYRPAHPGGPYNGRGRFYGVGIPYASPYGYGAGWIAPYYLGYPDDSGIYDGPVTAPDDGGQTYLAPPPPDQGPLPADAYQTYAEPPAPQASASAPAPEPEDAVTLIFKDGRPPEQIHNYALTRTTLYVRDQHKRDIPVADLDLVATEKANRDAGVQFQLP